MSRLMTFFGGLPMTIVSGICLAASLLLVVVDCHVWYDPAWITIVVSGLPLLYLAIHRLIYQHWLSSAMLISIALVACLSIGQLFAAGEVAWIMAVGALLEDYTVARARRGITRCASLMPLTARRLDGMTHAEEMVPLSAIAVGDILRVVPGEQIPIDGIIVAGETTINQAIMTGEAIPVDKTCGDSVFCGTINGLGAIDIRATHLPQDTALNKMIALVEEAQMKKAPMQRLADKWATYLVPIALIIAVLAGLLTGQWQRAVTVLVVFCPCALALATPVAIVAGIAQATTRGIIIKSGEALERMGHVDTIAFDKTGTLTEGTLTVTDIIPATRYSVEALLRLTASIEALSEHPIAQAITHYHAIPTALLPIKAFTVSPGRGVTGIEEHDSTVIVCGNSSFLEEKNIAVPDYALGSIAALQQQGKAIVLTAVNGSYAGVIALADTIRPTAPTLIRELTTMGIAPVMLTGDNTLAAQHVAQQVALTTVKANLLPADKVSVISALQQQGHTVAMIGDGVNDAAALTTAHVGIAMADVGSDIAIDAADIALMGDNIQRIPYLVRLAHAVRRSITVNISLSMAINAIAITLSTLGLLTPVTGALVHNAGSVLVVLNAALLYDRKI